MTTTTIIVALLLAVLTTTVAASNGVLSLGDYEHCIGTELNTDIAAEMCSRAEELYKSKTSFGRSICVRTTRCTMVQLYGLKGRGLPSTCVLPANASESDEHEYANTFGDDARDLYNLCAHTVEAACGKASANAILKVTLRSEQTLNEVHAGYLTMKDTINSLNKEMTDGFESTNTKLDSAVLDITGNITEAAKNITAHTIVLTRLEWYFNIACGMIGLICFTLVAFAYFWRQQEQRQRRIDTKAFVKEFLDAVDMDSNGLKKKLAELACDGVADGLHEDNENEETLKGRIARIAREAIETIPAAPGPAAAAAARTGASRKSQRTTK